MQRNNQYNFTRDFSKRVLQRFRRCAQSPRSLVLCLQFRARLKAWLQNLEQRLVALADRASEPSSWWPKSIMIPAWSCGSQRLSEPQILTLRARKRATPKGSVLDQHPNSVSRKSERWKFGHNQTLLQALTPTVQMQEQGMKPILKSTQAFDLAWEMCTENL